MVWLVYLYRIIDWKVRMVKSCIESATYSLLTVASLRMVQVTAAMQLVTKLMEIYFIIRG